MSLWGNTNISVAVIKGTWGQKVLFLLRVIVYWKGSQTRKFKVETEAEAVEKHHRPAFLYSPAVLSASGLGHPLPISNQEKTSLRMSIGNPMQAFLS